MCRDKSTRDTTDWPEPATCHKRTFNQRTCAGPGKSVYPVEGPGKGLFDGGLRVGAPGGEGGSRQLEQQERTVADKLFRPPPSKALVVQAGRAALHPLPTEQRGPQYQAQQCQLLLRPSWASFSPPDSPGCHRAPPLCVWE